MQYTVTGANRDTGAEVRVTLEARDFHDAEHQANAMGIVVAEVREAQAAAPAQPTPQYAPQPYQAPVPRVAKRRTSFSTIFAAVFVIVGVGVVLSCCSGFVSTVNEREAAPRRKARPAKRHASPGDVTVLLFQSQRDKELPVAASLDAVQRMVHYADTKQTVKIGQMTYADEIMMVQPRITVKVLSGPHEHGYMEVVMLEGNHIHKRGYVHRAFIAPVN